MSKKYGYERTDQVIALMNGRTLKQLGCGFLRSPKNFSLIRINYTAKAKKKPQAFVKEI